MAERLYFSEILKQHKKPEEKNIRQQIERLIASKNIKIVILDDDPTGIQTVHGNLLLTNWKEESLELAFKDNKPFFYILTNTRSVDAVKAEQINRDVVEKVLKVNQQFKFKLIFISRSDSTLRGHFPLESDTIVKVLKENNFVSELPVFFSPCFLEAGRITYDDTHYLVHDDEMIPTSETEFAKDNVFGYRNANLFKYVTEKENRQDLTAKIASISIEDIRTKELDELSEQIEAVKGNELVIINAMEYIDLYRIVHSILNVITANKQPLVLRTSSSVPKSISGIPDKAFLVKDDLVKVNKSGIFIVGSHVQKTTSQLKELLKQEKVDGIEIDVREVLESPKKLLKSTLSQISTDWEAQKTPVIYTSRKEVRIDNKLKRLHLGQKISDFLVRIVSHLPSQPAYLVAKGGITSNDILTKGLEISSARVAGQILAGIPVIQTSAEHKFAYLPYIIFPGNVGDKYALATVFEKMK